MSMPTRSRPGSGPLLAVALIVVSIIAMAAALWAAGITPQEAWDSFFPMGGETPATDRAHAVAWLYDWVFGFAVVIFLAVEGVIIYSAFRYRRRARDTELPAQTHGNNLIEVIWTAIPTAIVLFLFVLSWQALNTVDAKAATDVRIRAVAARFQWSFDYLDPAGELLFTQVIPIGEDGGMVVPVDEPVSVELRAQDVIHAFYVPRFLFKRDAVPGKPNFFDFTVEEPGTYRGQCAELCGASHGAMVFDVHAVPRAEYDVWFQAQLDKASATPAPAPSGGAATTLELSAINVAFSASTLEAPAGQPFAIHFVNNDASVPHNVEIKDTSGTSVFKGDLITGPSEITYSVPELAAGTYTFVCTVHPNMTGTLTVQ
jgi:cytochrome c oxidase subunit 2